MTVADIPDDFRAVSIGKLSAIIEGIKEVIPTADFSDPSWGNIEGPDWSVEVNIGTGEECGGFALHVRGGDAAVGAVTAVLQHLQLRAIDSQTGEFFVADDEATVSFRKWRSYRDCAVNEGNK